MLYKLRLVRGAGNRESSSSSSTVAMNATYILQLGNESGVGDGVEIQVT